MLEVVRKQAMTGKQNVVFHLLTGKYFPKVNYWTIFLILFAHKYKIVCLIGIA